ncbi:hypothetical protein ACFQ1S_13420 [Kibdelosporangium lantanae]|uniref:Restriction endonuclease n=1 Tax=Kibdelosporangium lantanae TaxID=1497396 RepID=A0ABW3M8M0_9PSEU
MIRAMPLIAGTVDLEAAINALRARRPLFHSEADLQHAFGQALHALDPALHIRLEVPRDETGRWHIDMICHSSRSSTAIEFKYFTSAWSGADPFTDEAFLLREHGAPDLARRNFVFDIARLERLRTAAFITDGIALLLTNDSRLWRPHHTGRTTNDHAFRIHEGTTLTGNLAWANGMYPGNTRTLTGTYPLRWSAYSDLPHPNGTFRWVAASVCGIND